MSENQKEPQYKLRWPEDLRDKVMASAKEQNRSINAEIIARLEQSFEHCDVSDLQQLNVKLEAQASQLTEQYNYLVEQQQKQALLIKELTEFHEWKKSKKPT